MTKGGIMRWRFHLRGWWWWWFALSRPERRHRRMLGRLRGKKR